MIIKRKIGQWILMAAVTLPAWGPTAASSGLPQEEGPRIVKLTAQRFKFVPSKFKLHAGEEVVLKISSRDVMHGFKVPELNLDVRVPSRGRPPIELKLRFDKPGKYAFRCSHVCGAGHASMRGTIIVRPKKNASEDSVP